MIETYEFTCPRCGGHRLAQVEEVTRTQCIGNRIGVDRMRGSDLLRILHLSTNKNEPSTESVKRILYRCDACAYRDPATVTELIGRGELTIKQEDA